MTKSVRERVLKGEIVDTWKYRYICHDCHDSEKQWKEIFRLPLECLDTTLAIDSWESVEKIF